MIKPYHVKLLEKCPAMHSRQHGLLRASIRFDKIWTLEKALLTFLVIMIGLYITGTLAKLGGWSLVLMSLAGLASSVSFVVGIVTIVDRFLVTRWKHKIVKLYKDHGYNKYIPDKYLHF